MEAIAREVHDEWWRRRLSDGWTYGPQRDDESRQHPSLVPYEELSEEERAYDRGTVLATIRGLRRAGFRIVPDEARTTPDASPDADEERNPSRYAALAEVALKEGRPLVAYEITTQGLTAAPSDVRLRQLQALALARSGAPESASRILEALAEEGHADEETLGLLARTQKDAALSASDPEVAAERMRQSLETYARSYRATGGYYTGINAATLALLCGESERSLSLAREVEAIARRELDLLAEESSDAYYPLATLAEAALLQDDEEAAQRWLARALEVGRNRFGDLASTRRNLRLILQARGRDPEVLDSWVPIPRVGVVSGTQSGWSAAEAGQVEPPLCKQVDDWIKANRVEMVYGGGSPGLDLLVTERVQAREGRSFLVLPHAHPEVGPEGSVSAFWAERLERAAAAADECITATDQNLPGTAVFERFASELRLGLAMVHARLLDTEVVMLGASEGGGTSPDELELLTERSNGSMRIVAVLFADVLRYSALEDRQIPLFVDHFLGMVGRVADSTQHRPLARNTWGDGLYFVFASVQHAGLFALELQQAVSAMDWEAVGLRADLALRIGLHAGPVFGCADPVTGAPMFTGRHTVRAARIEPVTPPGMIYCSREFAALATAEGVREFACEPVGRVDLAKGAANLPLFVVRTAAAG